MLQTGEKAPLFRAESTRGEVNLAALVAERPVVVYFFPQAFTPG